MPRDPIPPTPEQVESALSEIADKTWQKILARCSKHLSLFIGPRPRAGSVSYPPTEFLSSIPEGVAPAELLSACTKRNPQRFFKLLEGLPGRSHPTIFEVLIRTLLESGQDLSSLYDRMRQDHHEPERPWGRRILRLATPLLSTEVPAEVLDMLAWYATEATHDHDLESGRRPWEISERNEDAWQFSNYDGQLHNGDPRENGRQIVRGQAVLAIGEAIRRRPERLERFRPALERLSNDRSVSVRACTAEVCCSVYGLDSEAAIGWMLALCDTTTLPKYRFENTIYGVDPVGRFLESAVPAHYSRLAPLAEKMAATMGRAQMTLAARAAAAAAAFHPEAQPFADRMLDEVSETRSAMTKVLAESLGKATERAYVAARLSQLFSDDDANVRYTAGQCFWHSEIEDLTPFAELSRVFVNTPALKADLDSRRAFVAALLNSDLAMPDLDYGMVVVLFRAMRSREAGALAERVLTQDKDPDSASKCRDVVAVHENRQWQRFKEFKPPWEEPDSNWDSVEKRPPAPNWHDKYYHKLYPPKPRTQPKKPVRPKEGPGISGINPAKTARSAGKNDSPADDATLRSYMPAVFALLLVFGYIRGSMTWRPSVAASFALGTAVLGCGAIYAFGAVKRRAPRLADSWVIPIAGAVLAAAFLFVWTWITL